MEAPNSVESKLLLEKELELSRMGRLQRVKSKLFPGKELKFGRLAAPTELKTSSCSRKSSNWTVY